VSNSRYSTSQKLALIGSSYGRILDRIQHAYSDYNHHKAVCILEWMACSYRPLKVHEVQDGILFEPGIDFLNEERKLNRSVLEVCKPIIEEGVGNTVSFVHFSAKELVSLRCVMVLSLMQYLGTFYIEGVGHLCKRSMRITIWRTPALRIS
jgi:hypothetical protein